MFRIPNRFSHAFHSFQNQICHKLEMKSNKNCLKKGKKKPFQFTMFKTNLKMQAPNFVTPHFIFYFFFLFYSAKVFF